MVFKSGNPWQCVALDFICDGGIDCDKGNVEVGLGDDEIGCAENCPKDRPAFVYNSTQVNSTCCVKGRTYKQNLVSMGQIKMYQKISFTVFPVISAPGAFEIEKLYCSFYPLISALLSLQL